MKLKLFALLAATLFLGCDRAHLGIEASYNINNVHDITVEKGHPQAMELVVEYDGSEKGTVNLELTGLPSEVLAKFQQSPSQVPPFRDTIIFTARSKSANGDYPVVLKATSARFGNRYEEFVVHVTGELECMKERAGDYICVSNNLVTSNIGDRYAVYYNEIGSTKRLSIQSRNYGFLFDKEAYIDVNCDDNTLLILDEGLGASGHITGSFTKDSMTLVYNPDKNYYMVLARQ